MVRSIIFMTKSYIFIGKAKVNDNRKAYQAR